MVRASLSRLLATLLILCALSFPLRAAVDERQAAALLHPRQYTVYLTFDDGPSDNTDAVLDILLQENIRATFFVTGTETEAGIALYQRTLDEGHALGLHSYSHNTSSIYASLHGFQSDFKRLDNWLQQTTGETLRICRMVGGSNTQRCNAQVREEILTYLYEDGYICYDWDIDSIDSLGYAVSADQIARNVISAARKKRGQDLIILLHDDALRKTLPDALVQIIRYFQQNDFAFAPLREDAESIKRILPKKHRS